MAASSKALTEDQIRALVRRDVGELAPGFALQLFRGLARCWWKGLDPVIYEAVRTQEVQAAYYALGRTVPGSKVTNAQDAQDSWHFYGLAVDVISRAHLWAYPPGWIEAVAAELEAEGLVWGGRWPGLRDLPHFQFGPGMRRSPSPRARELFAAGGRPAVWREVGALLIPST